MLISKQLFALLDGPVLGSFYSQFRAMKGWSVVRSMEDKWCRYVHWLKKTFHLNLVGNFRGKVTKQGRGGGILSDNKIFLDVLLLKYKKGYKKLEIF